MKSLKQYRRMLRDDLHRFFIQLDEPNSPEIETKKSGNLEIGYNQQGQAAYYGRHRGKNKHYPL